MKAMLEGVISEGTGKNILYNPLYKIAGKTGTAQVADGNKGYKAKRQYQSSFCGYFPADKPKYSMIVVINDPKNGYYGALVAGPVFREIADRVYSSDIDLNQAAPVRMVNNTESPKAKTGRQKALQEVYTKLGVKPIYAKNMQTSIDTNEGIAGDSEITHKKGVPSTVGMGLRDALFIMGNAGYKIAVIGSGTVVRQSVGAGSIIPKGSKIVLELE